MIFHHGLDLPHFASFKLLEDEQGRAALRDYFSRFLAVARERDAGFILDTATWRSNPDWGALLGYDAAALDRVNREAVAFAREIRDEHGEAGGADPRRRRRRAARRRLRGRRADVGRGGAGLPRGPGALVRRGRRRHGLRDHDDLRGGGDRDRRAPPRRPGIPVAISFTVETDGRLPSGQALGDAIAQVDSETGGSVAYYMVNCAHPSHFEHVLAEGGAWLGRIAGLRANASTLSHAELDEAEELDEGDPDALGAGYVALRAHLRNVNVLGGCCGTDERHVAAVAAAWDAGSEPGAAYAGSARDRRPRDAGV